MALCSSPGENIDRDIGVVRRVQAASRRRVRIAPVIV
jgi:hypothetical protein